MEDDASIFLDGKTLANLRVVDLKLELEKRGLSKSGSKKDLVKRLKQQLEFEKLCGERKSIGDCDLKLELDADTEQNEFVQQYLAQQQKIYAQQKEAKRRVELEEIQKSGDEKESCDSTKGDDDKTEDESETEPQNQKADKVTNDTMISLPPNKHTKDANEDVFEATDTAQSSSVNQAETKNPNAENIKKNRKISAQDEYSAERHQPNAEVRDIEKDREKELSTAISSLLSVEKSEKEAVNQEDVSVAADLNAVDGGLTRMSHDDDREKDQATAVLSSLLVDQDVETEVKVDHNVEAKVDPNIEAKVDHNVEAKVDHNVEAKVDHNVEAKVDHNVEAKVDHNVEMKDEVCQNVEMEAKVDRIVKMKNKVDHNVETKNEVVYIVETEAKMDHDVEKQVTVDHNIKAQAGVDHNAKRQAEVDHHVETNVVVADACSKVDSQLESVDSKTSSRVDQTCEKSLGNLGVEVNVKRIIVIKDECQSSPNEKASLELAQEPPVKPNKITQAVQEEINSKMDVSSVPYSLSEIQLPESPVNIVKPQSKSHPENESAKNTQSDEDLESNNISSKSNKVKRSESGGLNGNKEKSSEAETTFEKEPENENAHHEKLESAKRSRVEQSESETSSDDEKSRLGNRKGKGHRKKHNSSDEDHSPVKRSSDSSKSKSDRRKDRRNRSPGSEEDLHSRDRSRSPKGSKSSRRHHRRSRSSEKDHHSKTKSKKSSRDGRRKRDRKHKSESPEERSMTRDRSPKKSSKISRREQSVSSEEDRPSRTRSRVSPKRDIKVSRKEPSVSSDGERSSRMQVKETKESRSERSVTPEKEPSIPDDKKSGAVQSPENSRRSPEKERHSRPHSKESPKKESRTSHKEQSPRKKAHGSEDEQDSGSSRSSESSPKKAMTKDPKRKHSISSDEGSRGQESPVKKPEKLSKPEDTQDKMDCQSPRDEPLGSSRRDRSTEDLRQNKGRSSSRSISPSERVAVDNKTVESSKSSLRPPSPKEPCGPSNSDSSSSEKNDGKPSSKKLPKAILKEDVSDGELSSSGEGSPVTQAGETVSKWGLRKTSTDLKQGTMTVIRKETPKQRLKIKRDNVVVVKKDSESVPEDSQSITEAPVVETPELIEDQKLEPGECSEAPASITYVSRKITLANRKRTEKTNEETSNKRSKWGSFAASRKATQTVSISTDSLKNWFPDFKLLKEPAAELIPEEPPSPVKETNDVEMTPVEKDVDEPKPIAMTRRLEPPPLEEDSKTAVDPQQPEEDAVDPTRILFVRNLVRPFTLLQLKELLRETGRTVDDGFWIDKIKSKCFVTYETEEEAIKTRKALNGARWPMSNPKILAVDFATEEDLTFHRLGGVEKPKPIPPPSPPMEEDRREGKRERLLPMREWDKDKVTQESPEKMDRRHHEDKDKKEVKRRPNEDTPAKLLDDLFQKTKATPCIYWLPLTEEQVKERAEKLRQINLERERRNQEREQENKRPRSRQRGRETDNRKSSSRSRSPVPRRR